MQQETVNYYFMDVYVVDWITFMIMEIIALYAFFVQNYF